MEVRTGRNSLFCIWIFNFLCAIILDAAAQDYNPPMRGQILLSGNFGELRATHFHSGIDIKTGGREGLPVLCVKDGRVVRVVVSPVGYGKALYIEHSDGTTTVYGHLRNFDGRLDSLVRDIQYRLESFAIDENISKENFVYRKGDIIAYSGNTGSSGGPHLHFEVRRTCTENTLNPLSFYSIKDQMRPLVKGVYLYSVDDNGFVRYLRSVPLRQNGVGKYEAGVVKVPAGLIGIGVFAVDYMEGSWNKLGIYQMNLSVGNDTLFKASVDSLSFAQSRFVNVLKDFHRYKKHETVYRCFGHYHSHLLGVSSKDNGCILVKCDSIVPIALSLADINGNTTSARFCLRGDKSSRQSVADSLILRYDSSHVLQVGEWSLELDSLSLLSSVLKNVHTYTDSLSEIAAVALASEDVPLVKKARLCVRGDFDAQTVICEVDPSGKYRPVMTRRSLLESSGKSVLLEASVDCLSRYVVMRDTISPKVSFIGKVGNSRLRFKIKDDFTGVASYCGKVNGRWCLFSYDPRSSFFECRLDEPVFNRNVENTVEIVATDAVGNSTSLKVAVYLP